MNIASAIAFDTAEREYNDAWNAPSSTRFELPPVDVNKVLKERYRVSPEQSLTRAMIWDMETRKAWDPLTYIPYVVSQARSWGRTTLRDGTARFCRSSLQRGWIAPEEGRVLEDVFVSDAKQTIYFLGRPRMVEESGNALVASPFQPLFHVRHAVGGAEQAPLNLWSIVHLTDAPDPRYCEPFEQMVRAGLLPGFLASLNQPGGNATGISWLSAELAAKRLGLLRELIPAAADVGLLINPADPTRAEFAAQDVEAAARASGLQIRTFKASSAGEIDASFAALARDRIDALFVAPDILFNLRRVKLAILAATHRIPATYPVREFAEAGGLMSYGASIDDALRQAGIYAARILKGAKPADLPVLQPTKFELVINLNTARALGLAVPSALLALADEVIE